VNFEIVGGDRNCADMNYWLMFVCLEWRQTGKHVINWKDDQTSSEPAGGSSNTLAVVSAGGFSRHRSLLTSTKTASKSCAVSQPLSYSSPLPPQSPSHPCARNCPNRHSPTKISGHIKFNSANSSFKLFCSGVPVMSSRPREINTRTICDRRESTFLMRCASSMMIYSKLKADFSMRQIS